MEETDQSHSECKVIDTSINAFWQWLQNRCGNNIGLLGEDSTLLYELNQQLGTIDDSLMAYMRSDMDQPLLVISPLGQVEKLALTDEIISLAPDGTSLKVISCVPRAALMWEKEQTLGEMGIPLDAIKVILEEGRGVIDLTFGLPNYDETSDEPYITSILNLLDVVLGERDVLTRVGEIRTICANNVQGHQCMFPDLRDYFDVFCETTLESYRYRCQLSPENRTNKVFNKYRLKIARELSLMLEQIEGGASVNACEMVFIGQAKNQLDKLQRTLYEQRGGTFDVQQTYSLLGNSVLLSYIFSLTKPNFSDLFHTINQACLTGIHHSFEMCDVTLASR